MSRAARETLSMLAIAALAVLLPVMLFYSLSN